jgi:hypothetical protein
VKIRWVAGIYRITSAQKYTYYVRQRRDGWESTQNKTDAMQFATRDDAERVAREFCSEVSMRTPLSYSTFVKARRVS